MFHAVPTSRVISMRLFIDACCFDTIPYDRPVDLQKYSFTHRIDFTDTSKNYDM